MTLPWLHRFGRRSFLERTAIATAGLSCFGCAEGPVTVLPHPIVVGSGFGGAVAALRLAESGIATSVLERGRRWDITPAGDTFTSLRDPDERAGWLTTQSPIGLSTRIRRYTGLVERFEGEGIDAVIGAGVGGGSLAYAGLMVQPPRDLFESVLGAEVSYDEMIAEWYPKVLAELPASTVPSDVLAAEPYRATRLFMEHAEAAGLAPEHNLLAIDWDLVRAELAGDLPAEVTAGDYVYGLNSGAKRSVDRSYLARAEETGLVDVLPLHQVVAIAADASGGYRVECERIDERGEAIERLVFRTPALFLAAGSVHSTRLLVEARAHGRMPMLESAVGEGWGHNGQHIHMRSQLGVDVGPYQGGPPTALVRSFDNPIAPVTVELGAAPFGYECGCMICPSSSVVDGLGAIAWDAQQGRSVLRWDEASGATAVAAGEWVTARMNDATAGILAPLPGASRRATFHPLGGVAMGRAADDRGRVRGYAGLYVVDGSLIPGSTPTANPAWTIAALAERNIAAIIAEDFA